MANNGDDSASIPPPEAKKRKRFSAVWKYFSVQDGQYRCNDCGTLFQCSTATTSLRYHLENSHPTLVDNSIVVAESMTTFEAKRAEQLLTKFIVSNYLAFRLVDSESFRAFVNYLQPKWKVCDRKKLSMVLTPALRAEIELQMKKRMSNIDHFSISLDSWTSLANRAYLALTAHGISKNFEFESFLLDITVVKKSETGEYIAELVRDILEAWAIDMDQVVAGTSDGASNCKKAIKRDLDLLWIYCLAHALNRSVRIGLDSNYIRDVLKKAKGISKFFRASPKASKVLLKQQQHLHLSTKKMKIDNKTRWGSAYKMLKRLLASRAAVSATLAIVTGTRKKPPVDLTSAEWKTLENLAKVLRPLHEATNGATTSFSFHIALFILDFIFVDFFFSKPMIFFCPNEIV